MPRKKSGGAKKKKKRRPKVKKSAASNVEPAVDGASTAGAAAAAAAAATPGTDTDATSPDVLATGPVASGIVSQPLSPSPRPKSSCSFCYKITNKTLCCSRCGTRAYCSRECQRADWKQHRQWCGRSATLDVDYAVRGAGEGRGFGMFALRSFVKGDKIHVERCVVKVDQDNLGAVKQVMALTEQLAKAPSSVRHAVMALYPTEAPDSEDDRILIDAFPAYFKFKYNTFELEPAGHGLCVTASRFNHACLPNCGRQFVGDQQLMVISAAADIAAGEELTIRYTEANLVRGYGVHRDFIRSTWGFTCDCRSCREPELASKLVRMALLDAKLGSLGHARKPDQALEIGDQLLQLYDQVGALPIHYQRTYYDMFQMAVMRSETLSRATAYMRKTAEYFALTIGGSRPQPQELLRAIQWVDHPETHELHLCLDK